MKILVLNIGSSSVKFKLFEMNDESVIANGYVQQIGEKSSYAKLVMQENGKIFETNRIIKTHLDAIKTMDYLFEKSKVLTNLSELGAIGHRIVHGGYKYFRPTLIDENVINDIKEMIPFAPIHNPAHIIGIRSVLSQAPKVKNIAVFDTAFHQDMPKTAFMYAIPHEFYDEYKIRKYGAHGTSHEFVYNEAAKFLGKKRQNFSCITIHLGSGASICAIKNAKSMDTSMGLTPLAGLMMGTRCGDIDPSVMFYLNECTKLSVEQISTIFNKNSGLMGICGTNDMREIVLNKDSDERSNLAYKMFCYRVKKYIGAYMAILDKLDAIVFTATIGEHSPIIRGEICENLSHLGIKIDAKKNDFIFNDNIVEIGAKSSKIRLLVVPTNEELHIARQTYEVIKDLR